MSFSPPTTFGPTPALCRPHHHHHHHYHRHVYALPSTTLSAPWGHTPSRPSHHPSPSPPTAPSSSDTLSATLGHTPASSTSRTIIVCYPHRPTFWFAYTRLPSFVTLTAPRFGLLIDQLVPALTLSATLGHTPESSSRCTSAARWSGGAAVVSPRHRSSSSCCVTTTATVRRDWLCFYNVFKCQ